MKKIIVLIGSFLCMVNSYAQIIANFETPELTPVVTADGNIYDIADNPDKSGINISDMVGFYHKLDTNWQYFTMTFNEPVNIENNNTLTFKVHASAVGRIFAKFWNNSDILFEHWAPEYEFMPAPNRWVECTMDLTPAMNQSFTALQIAACVNNDEEADIYLDDFTLSNPDAGDGSPFIKFKVSESLIEENDSITFDASASYDYDGVIDTYEWDFGDGQTDTGKVATHKFLFDSVFNVKLTITDNDLKSKSAQSYVFVVPVGEKLSKLKIVTDSPETNKKIEAIFQINKTYTNVFNPDEVEVNAEITLPDAKKISIPCFFYEKSSYNKTDWVVDSSLQCWMLRFSSPLPGSNSIVIKLKDTDGEIISEDYTMDIIQGSNKGIVHNDSANRQYYRHTTGEPYYPLGINACWDNITDYTNIITNLGNNRANLFRYWHTGFAKQTLEWKTGGYYKGLGYYSQQAAAMTDSLIELCHEYDVLMQLVIFQHGMFSENVDPNWDNNPYNIINGGLIDRAEEFFYTPGCKEYVKKLLRYIVARWGYSSNIFAWEFFNEVQFTGVNNSQSPQWYPGVLQWHSEMGRYVESIDPYNHILTTSAADNQLPDLDTVRALDIVQYHQYSATLYETLKEKDAYFLSTLNHSSIINGEYGTNNAADVPFDEQRYLVWSGIMTQVPRYMWIWDHYTDVTWAAVFDMPGKYLEDLDISSEGEINSAEITLTSPVTGLKAIGLNTESKSSYGYIFNPSGASAISGAVAKISGIPYANYKLTYYLPESNQIEVVDSIPLVSQQVKILLPDFIKGIAYKIQYLSAYSLPIAIAGRDTLVSPGTIITYSGLNSVNPYAKPLSYHWRIVQKPASSVLQISDPTSPEIEVIPDVIGEYRIGLTVNDDSLTSTENVVSILVTSIPVAIAGNDVIVSKAAGFFVNLDGSSSYDPEGSTLTYKWTMISKPEGSNGTIFQDIKAKSNVRIDSIGEYLVTLVVNDGVASSIPDTVKITITSISSIDYETLSNLIELYPNPCSDVLYINLNSNLISVERFMVIDITGKCMAEVVPSDKTGIYQVNLSEYNLKNGIYFLKSITPAGFAINKFIMNQ